ncbi:MAG: hypothetical protein EP330_00610 [Deltaproteobacteria bacterium]|nr:MAG: hypothetical protein EP330_00610 [Deltaproteobacteria bacterium]
MTRWFPLALLTACSAYGDGLVKLEFDGELWDAPVPSQHMLADGLVQLQGIDNPDDVGFVDDLVELIDGDLDGFGTTSTLFLPLHRPVDPGTLPDLAGSLADDDASVQLVHIDSGVRVPIDVRFVEAADPYGPDGPHLAVLPLQGIPLEPDSVYALLVTTDVHYANGEQPEPSAVVHDLARGRTDLAPELAQVYSDALDALPDELRSHLAGASVFRTQDPVAELHAVTAAMAIPSVVTTPTLTDVFDEYCVYRGTLSVENFQDGELPYQSEGGRWRFDAGAPVSQGTHEAYVDITVPRGAMPTGGWPLAVLVRTGAGGARALVDRGVRDAEGAVAIAGSGPALTFARAGFAGLSMDGPHTGLRNTGGDEQFLMFNIGNPPAMRDNVRQTAAELAALPGLLDTWSLDTSDCPDASPSASFDLDHLALAGHSMGATVSPLVLAASEEYDAVILSGAGGSWIENVVHKQKPLQTAPIAENLLGYREGELTEFDPALMLLQWAGESADPPAMASAIRPDLHVLMVQGIVDHYIMPPIANSTSLSLGLDLVGPSADAAHPELVDYRPLESLLAYGDGAQADLPYTGSGATRVVFQQPEDGVEDGHEVWFQTEAAKHLTRCFLSTWLSDGTPTIPQPGGEQDPC